MDQDNLPNDMPNMPPPLPPMARPAAQHYAPNPQASVKEPWRPLHCVSTRDAILDLCLIVGVLLGLMMIVPGVASMLLGTSVLDFVPPAKYLVVDQCIQAAISVTFLIYLFLRTKTSAKDFGLTICRPHWAFFPIWVPASIFGCYLVMGITVLFVGVLSMMLPELQENLVENQDAQERFFNVLPKNPWMVIALMIPVAIHEEIIFRGLLLPYLKRLTGRWWLAVLISSVIFGGLHVSQGTFAPIPLMLVGAVLAITFILTRSLAVVILAHATFNIMQTALAPFLFEIAEKAQQAQGG